jgi:hypothetical protein
VQVVAPGARRHRQRGSKKGKESKKGKKNFLPFLLSLPFLLPFDRLTKPFAKPPAQSVFALFVSSWFVPIFAIQKNIIQSRPALCLA